MLADDVVDSSGREWISFGIVEIDLVLVEFDVGIQPPRRVVTARPELQITNRMGLQIVVNHT